MKQIFKEAAVILGAAMFAALIFNSLRENGIHLFPPKARPVAMASPAAGNPLPQGPGSEISLAAAITHFQNNTALFIDARLPADFNQGHIKGAINLPELFFSQEIESFFSKTPADKPLITYCHGPVCQLGRDLAEKLVMVGYENTYYLHNGWGLWLEKALPVEKQAADN